MLELYLSVDKIEKGIVSSASHVVTGMDLGAALTNENVTCGNRLTVCLLYAKSLGLGVTAVLGRTNTFFMSKKLQT